MIIQKKIIEFLEINYLIVYTFTLFFINFARRAKCRVDSVSPKDLQNKSYVMKSLSINIKSKSMLE